MGKLLCGVGLHRWSPAGFWDNSYFDVGTLYRCDRCGERKEVPRDTTGRDKGDGQ
jgi:hypothetical protein